MRVVFRLFAILFMLGVLSAAASAHEYYVAICEMEILPPEESIEITFKIFIDDLETALGNGFQVGNAPGDTAVDRPLFSYLFDTFSLLEGGASLPLNPVGWELEGDVMWIYVEVLGFAPSGSLTIRNEVLFETFADQINLTHINVGKRQKSLMFRRSHPQEEIRF